MVAILDDWFNEEKYHKIPIRVVEATSVEYTSV